MKKTKIGKAILVCLGFSSGIVLANDYVSIIYDSTARYIYDVGEMTEGWSSWYDVGEKYSCGSWLPIESTENLGNIFEQTQSCSQDQERKMEIYSVASDGTKTLIKTNTENQTATVFNKQDSIGTKDYVLNQTTDAWSNWSNVGGFTSCNSWTPSNTTVNLGTSFTQKRNCNQEQARTQNVYDNWASGAVTQNSVNTESQTLTNQEDSQQSTGTKDYILNQSTGSWSGWSNSGGLVNCSSWSPSTTSREKGTTFTQNQYCEQVQTRSQITYNNWASGAQTVHSTASGSQTLTNIKNSRSAVGNRPLEWRSHDYQGGMSSCSGGLSSRPRGSCSNHGQTVYRCTIDSGHPGNNTYYAKITYRCS